MTTNRTPTLNFDEVTPRAPHALGGLIQDHFSNGRLAATLTGHGGLINIAFSGTQHLGGFRMFQADATTAWSKLFRFCVLVDGKSYYPILKDTQIFPFGIRSHCQVAGVEFVYDLFLLKDALVQRVKFLSNKKNLPLGMQVVHQEAVTAINIDKRTWLDMAFDRKANAVITCCTDRNPGIYRGDGSLAQRGFGLAVTDAVHNETWIGVGSDFTLTARRGYHKRSKHYLSSKMTSRGLGSFFVVFEADRKKLGKRLSELRKSVHKECDALLGNYYKRLASQPQIKTGSKILDSAFSQYPEMINSCKIPDRPGAVKATMAGYFVWGWDGMMPLIPTALANEPDYTASILRFFQETRHPRLGLIHAFTTAFKPRLKGPIPSQCQYIAGLYYLVSVTGDLSVAREMWPTCKFLLDRCQKDLVRDTGLVSGNALWPDFPEAMGEDGNDVSSMNNSLLYQALRSVEYLAGAIGKPRAAKEYGEWAAKLRKSFVKYLYDQEKGFFIASCSSKTLKPRKHYAPQSVFWLTPFARELVSHAPVRIANFMDEHLRTNKTLLTLPHWDTAWMADGNQLGSSFPAADSFYLGVHKIAGKPNGLDIWLGDVEWFWRFLTAPEAFTPEAENEDELGPDNTGCKQTQCVSTWYTGLFHGLAGLDFDHEGLTFAALGTRPLEINGLKLHGTSVNFKISGSGGYVRSIKLNGRELPAGINKIPWSALKGRSASLEFQRTSKKPSHPVIVRADGLSVTKVLCSKNGLTARVGGSIFGEVVVAVNRSCKASLDGHPVKGSYDASTKTLSISIPANTHSKLEISY